MVSLPDKPAIQVSAQEWTAISQILEKHAPTLKIWAFGSQVTGTTKPYSDLDLALITRYPLSLHDYASLKEAFDEPDLPYRVDIVDWAATSDGFRQIIQRQKIVIQQAVQAQESPR